MDKDITSWIMEVVLRRQQVDHLLIKTILSNPHFPLDNNNIRLKKTLLLRSLDSQISDGSVSETLLDSFEAIEELDRNNNILITDSMKSAYCAIALDCTLRYLWGNLHKTTTAQPKYLEAVQRIWAGRIRDLEMANKSRLLTDDLNKYKLDIEAALLDSDVRNRLKEANTRNDALLLTGAYITEAMTLMGPPFLESVARAEREAKEKEVMAQKEKKENDLMAAKDRDKKEKELRAEKEKKEKELIAASRKKALVLRAQMEAEEVELSAETENQKEAPKGITEGKAQVRESTGMEAIQNESREASSERKQKEKAGPSAQGVGCIADAVAESDGGGVAGQEILGLPNLSSKLIVADKPAITDIEIQRKIVLQKHKYVAERRRTKGRARITDSDELDLDVSSSKFDTLPTPEVKQAQEMLKSSSVELHAAVDDPLPNALHVADTVIAEMERKNPNQETLIEKHNGMDVDASDPSINGVTTEMESQIMNNDRLPENLKGKENHGHEKNISKPNLMDRNNTAHTYEWDDSIDDSPEGRINRPVRLDSPKRKVASPLRKYEVPNFSKRRKKKRWSVEEEDALREGVQKYGKGNWKLILSSKRDVFVERTEVDLKDKWRNMMR